ncbi:MAG: hypothetical protein RLZZ303_3614 [Candidatus Hydrogenedentota bacterium]
MMHAVAILAAFLVGQIPFYGEIPESVPTFRMTFPNGDVRYGALMLDDTWHQSENVSFPAGKTPTIIYDTPWNPGSDRVLRQPDYVVETLALRKQRLADEWKSNGFAPVQTREGERYVLASELELSRRAHEMEQALTAQPASPTSIPQEEPAAAAKSASGPVARWGLHAIVLAIGLGITVLVFRRMVLSEA